MLLTLPGLILFFNVFEFEQVCYVRLEELNNNEKELATMTMDKSSVERLLRRVDVLDGEGKYFATSNLESIARNGVPMEAVDELKLTRLEHMQLERYFCCPYSRAKEVNISSSFFYRV